ncbi:hypothetical protein DPMN_097880 [Dreissena polymorpha]|uniref:Uncharacterized protein n=1 Tax=Dreissena polymorpha TaxID=45954 RepID=A0A9D4R548_DREPO|nr:hypothetical protein DPMN_097880 [Dreissena polymorpha]
MFSVSTSVRTIESIKHSRGEHVTQPSSQPHGDWESEQRLIERTKRQSMQDMVGRLLSCYFRQPIDSPTYQIMELKVYILAHLSTKCSR